MTALSRHDTVQKDSITPARLQFKGKKPAMKRRGLHTLMRGKADLPAVKELITKHLPERRLNELILEINYFYEFKSHPEVAESGALSREDCRELAALAKRHRIHLVPMINCLGHQSWAKETFKLLATHPEFDETPALPKDNPGIYCRSWCPSHPKVHDFVADLCDELIDAFQADAFNVGMDEVFIMGECGRCKGKPNSELFAKAVNDLHRRLVGKRKVEMQLWGDRLLDAKTTKYSKWEASDNGTAPAIDLIPKDIVICDWHYGVLQDYPSVKLFLDKGFRVWPAGWDSAENARNLAATGLRNKSEKMLGYMATTWLGAETTVKILSGDEAALKSHKSAPGIVAGVNEGARISWEGKQ